MIRKIVDYQKLNEEILNLLIEKFPDGYDDSDIITFKNAQNEVVEAVEVRTESTIYLIKVGKRLVQAMEDFGDDINDMELDNEDESDIDFDELKGENDND